MKPLPHHGRRGLAASAGRDGNWRRELPCTCACWKHRSQTLTLRLGRCSEARRCKVAGARLTTNGALYGKLNPNVPAAGGRRIKAVLAWLWTVRARRPSGWPGGPVGRLLAGRNASDTLSRLAAAFQNHTQRTPCAAGKRLELPPPSLDASSGTKPPLDELLVGARAIRCAPAHPCGAAR